VEGSSLQSRQRNFVPKDAPQVLGLSNMLVWTSQDTVPHTMTSNDPLYNDKINDPFDLLQWQNKIPGGFILPSKTFEFTFTTVCTYPYHCTPHPWMQGQVEIVENFI
jgi:plastocyanin